MSYSINIAGHVDDADPAKATETETAIAEKARAFIADLEGVTNAGGSFQQIGYQDLRQPAAEPAAAEPTTPAAEPETPEPPPAP